jgi:hypothetical protein
MPSRVATGPMPCRPLKKDNECSFVEKSQAAKRYYLLRRF